MILYLSGPMSGIEERNFPAFNQAARELRDAGYQVINPAENWGGAKIDRKACMRLDIHQLLNAEGVATLVGHSSSAGARLEVAIADALEIPAHTVTHWLGAAVRLLAYDH